MNLNYILLDAAGATTNNASTGNFFGDFSGIFMIVIIIAVFYFFMIRPQNKRQKEIRNFRNGLQKGDKIVTAGGIHGKIKSINDKSADITIADGITITVELNSIYPNSAEAKTAGETAEGLKK